MIQMWKIVPITKYHTFQEQSTKQLGFCVVRYSKTPNKTTQKERSQIGKEKEEPESLKQKNVYVWKVEKEEPSYYVSILKY